LRCSTLRSPWALGYFGAKRDRGEIEEGTRRW
jgi:hypothetical protein